MSRTPRTTVAGLVGLGGVLLTGANGHDDGAVSEEATEVATEPVADTSEDDDSSDAIAIAGLIAGFLGLGLGGVALGRTRQTS